MTFIYGVGNVRNSEGIFKTRWELQNISSIVMNWESEAIDDLEDEDYVFGRLV